MTTPITLDEIYNYIIDTDLAGTPATDVTLGNLLLALGAAIKHSAGTVTDIVSANANLTVANPTGPTVTLTVPNITLANFGGLFGAAGQIPVGTGSGTGELLAAGTLDYVLTSNGPGEVVSWKSLPWFNVVSYGADPTGVADSTTAINEADAAAVAAGGGIVFFPPGGIYLYKGTYVRPVTATETAYLPGSPPIYQTNPVRWTSFSASTANPRGDTPTGGTIIMWDPPSTGSTMMTCRGSGTFEFDGIALFDISNNSNLFFNTTNTVLKLHDFFACGVARATAAATDLVVYGTEGATTANGGSNAIFNGYGSSLERVTMAQMRHLATLWNGANAIPIRQNVVGNTCGTNGADGLNAPIVLSTAIGNYIEDNDIELGWGTTVSPGPNDNGYRFAIYFANGSTDNYIAGNGFWDASTSVTAGMSFDSTSVNNRYVEGYRPSTLLWATGNTIAQDNVRTALQVLANTPGVAGTPVVLQQGGQFIQAWTESYTTDSSGYVFVSFPVAFPNGVSSVTATINSSLADSRICWIGQIFGIGLTSCAMFVQAPTGSSANEMAAFPICVFAVGS